MRSERPPVERRGAGIADKASLADQFAWRKAAYAARLAELQDALRAAGDDERQSLIEEAETIAHNLAGTAAMFGELRLGEQAAAVEDGLRTGGEHGSGWIDHLRYALARPA